ncbi:hypothetical protein EDB89DRAFT_1906803 [Lactarius sanguifluus]|nr:hypothetical protein EDB89DRAFT_1906803 [Lactarius sanguifluus]
MVGFHSVLLMASGITHTVLANAAYRKRGLGVACVPIGRPGTGIPDEEPVGAVNGPVATTGTVGQRRRNGVEFIPDRRSRKGGGRCTQYYDEEAVVVRSMTVDEDSALDGGRVGLHRMGICTEGLLMALAVQSAKKERNRVIRVDDFLIFEKNTKPGSEARTWVADLQEMACPKRRAAKEPSRASYPFQVSLVSVSDGAGQKEKGRHSRVVARGAYNDYGQTVDRAKLCGNQLRISTWKRTRTRQMVTNFWVSSRSRSQCSTIELTAASVVAGYLASNAQVHG